MIKIEKQHYLLIALEDPETEKLKDQILSLLKVYPELEKSIFPLSINKINQEIINEIKKYYKIATGKEEAKLPIFILKINAYSNDIDDFVKTVKKINFTNKKSGLILAFFGIDDPDIEYQLQVFQEFVEYDIEYDIKNENIFVVAQVVDINDVESSKKVEEYIRKLNKKIYDEEGLKLPVFGIFLTYVTTNLAEFEIFLKNINKLI